MSLPFSYLIQVCFLAYGKHTLVKIHPSVCCSNVDGALEQPEKATGSNSLVIYVKKDSEPTGISKNENQK